MMDVSRAELVVIQLPFLELWITAHHVLTSALNALVQVSALNVLWDTDQMVAVVIVNLLTVLRPDVLIMIRTVNAYKVRMDIMWMVVIIVDHAVNSKPDVCSAQRALNVLPATLDTT